MLLFSSLLKGKSEAVNQGTDNTNETGQKDKQ
jgi:hypothetical protein